MENKANKKLDAPEEEKKLPAPNEKLLRAPTFLELHSWIKPASIILVLLAVVIVSLNLIEQSKSKTDSPDPRNINILANPPTPIPTEPFDRFERVWQSYSTDEGRYSIKYPADSAFFTGPGPNTINIIQTIPDSNFHLSIQYLSGSGNQEFLQYAQKNNLFCDTSPIVTTGIINAGQPAEFYIDIKCESFSRTIIKAERGDMLYIITVESQSLFDELKPYVDEIISTFQFLDPVYSPTSPPIITEWIPADPTPGQEDLLCTQDAFQCPDGSFVGRTGPNCEFVCGAPDSAR